MPAPISSKIRLAVIKAIFDGESAQTAAERFQVSIATVRHWMVEARTARRFVPKQAGRPRVSKLDPLLPFILERLKEPGANIASIRDDLAEHQGMKVSHSALWEFLQKNGIYIERQRAKP